ncbi:NF038132 family protein [Alkalimonas amylolytica]|uniref:PEP-CTERM protein-sorting domain-containing protein n=1 Tax=Alkalimonas amylolytica TaxID=152573 RepID=A0A1H4A657_ALKAM|nr:NF038132 family protein [Alkalimonas amylolytica]SEA31407.1 PEP-CTERM protein-sorting domain-containing protein [Alkalimonas amylolytica]
MLTKKAKTMIYSCALLGALAFSSTASASLFDAGVPANWNCVGSCGAMGANGDVTLAPTSATQYGYVTTSNGITGVGLPGLTSDATTGSTLTSALFSAQAGDELNFFFNYVSSDGAGYADYAWARLLDELNNEVAILFTARTTPSGSIVPGFDMPDPTATLNPNEVLMNPGAPIWSALGSDSGRCWSTGCGYTGWISSSYNIAATGNYFLEFGVVNWSDTNYQSGMAFDGITVGGTPIGDINPVPAPATLGLLGLGLLGARLARRKK